MQLLSKAAEAASFTRQTSARIGHFSGAGGPGAGGRAHPKATYRSQAAAPARYSDASAPSASRQAASVVA